MSTIGSYGLKEVYMKLSSFGALHIEVTPHADNQEIMTVVIGAENRVDSLNMDTRQDETVDQFCGRVRSMLRALHNSKHRENKVEAVVTVAPKEQTWAEEKAGIKAGKTK